jgi:uroporphyrinogen decarboxylase
VDQVPVALWRHFPNDDLLAESLAREVVAFQNKYDFDLVKVTPAAGYPAEMYGATQQDAMNREGTRKYVTRPVSSLEDWNMIVPLDGTNSVFQRESGAMRIIRERLGDEVPILQTIFGPLNSAHNLAGERLFEDLREHLETVERALRAVTETTIRFAEASLEAGATAIFFATQMATSRYMGEEEFAKYGEPYDLQVIEALRGKADFILLHIHGLDIFFDRLARWPVQMLNWHDRRTPPSLRQARARTNLALAGGIDEWGTLVSQPREEIIGQVKDAIAETNGRGFMVAPGCVIPIDAPEESIRAVLEAVRGN